jgi:two-component system response regulator
MAPIVLADDDAAGAYLFLRALKEAGVQQRIVVVPDGETVMRYVEGQAEYADRFEFPLPCLLLLDQKLPGCSGLEVIDWLRTRSRAPALPALLLSASTYDSDVQAAYLVGANGYLVKPGSYEDTLAMARALKDFWLTFNRLPSL